MVDAIDLNVVGGPSTINVNVDLGAPGIRGSRYYGLEGDPNSVSTDALDLQNYDLVINVDPASPTYGTMFQWVDEEWIEIIDLNPLSYIGESS